MTELYFLVGPAGSGKSTWAQRLVENYLGIEWISSDRVRGEALGDENEQRDPHKVFEIVNSRALEHLKNGHSVIYDSTGLSSKNRINFLRMIKENQIKCKKFCICFFEPYEILCERQNLRERHVPFEVIKRQLKSFEVPCYGEGWDEIFRISNFHNENKLISIVTENRYTPHDNPHHSSDIGEHMERANSYAITYYGPDVATLAYYHDIGKPFCKTFINSKGIPDEVAHYYGHENYGAYLIGLYYPSSKNLDWLTAANVVQWHMIPWRYGEKKKAVIFNRLGDTITNYILKVHECDKAGH